MKNVLILGASDIQLPVIQECQRLGHRALVADYNPAAPGMRIADAALPISTNDVAAVLAAARQHAVDGILTTSDYPVRTVARVCRELGLCGLSERAATISTDKFLQRELLRSNGLRCPNYVLVNSLEKLLELAQEFQFPVIVKPVDSSASRGVSRVDASQGLEDAYALARSYSRSGSVLVEEFISGPEFSVEILVQDSVVHIVAVTEKTTGGDGHLFFVETRHVIPADLPVESTRVIHDTVRQAVLAAGLDNCASHTEIMLSPDGPVIIEIASRLGGDYITSDLVPLATGVSMLEGVVRISLGQKIDVEPRHSRAAGVQFVTPEAHARASMHFERIRDDARVCRMELRPKPDGAVLRSSLDRLGYCIASADTRDELLPFLEF
jgi:carbamoyl-phosphate synthase large subunit